MTDILGLAALFFVLGLKHGLDPDHLVAIDGFTRSSRSRWSGLFFSLGHRVVVTLVRVGFFARHEHRHRFHLPRARRPGHLEICRESRADAECSQLRRRSRRLFGRTTDARRWPGATIAFRIQEELSTLWNKRTTASRRARAFHRSRTRSAC